MQPTSHAIKPQERIACPTDRLLREQLSARNPSPNTTAGLSAGNRVDGEAMRWDGAEREKIETNEIENKNK